MRRIDHYFSVCRRRHEFLLEGTFFLSPATPRDAFDRRRRHRCRDVVHAAHEPRGPQGRALLRGPPASGGELLSPVRERVLRRHVVPQEHQGVHGSGSRSPPPSPSSSPIARRRRRPARRPAPPRRALTFDLSSVPHVFVGAGRRSHGLGKRRAERLGREVPGRDPGQLEGALSFTLVPIRPRSRGERRFLRTSPGVSLRPPLAFDPRPRRLSTPLLTPFNSTPTSLRMDPRP